MSTNNSALTKWEGVRERLNTAPGFIVALDESGGSTPNTLKAYGIAEDQYTKDGKIDNESMFKLAHELRVRMVHCDAFNSDHIVGVIVFEDTLKRNVGSVSFADYLRGKGIPTILKVDEGLQPIADGAQLMKELAQFDNKLKLARDNKVFATKMRSLVHDANEAGIEATVAQQFKIGKEILKAGLTPMVEPERSIKCTEGARADKLIKESIARHLETLQGDERVILKLTIPDVPGAFTELTKHPRVIRVVALSGGYSCDEACHRLARNPAMIASFSRASREGLSAKQSDAEFNATMTKTIKKIYEASVTKSVD